MVLDALIVSNPRRSHISPKRTIAGKLSLRRLGPKPIIVSYSGPFRFSPSSRRTTRPQAITQAWQALTPTNIVSAIVEPEILSAPSKTPGGNISSACFPNNRHNPHTELCLIREIPVKRYLLLVSGWMLNEAVQRLQVAPRVFFLSLLQRSPLRFFEPATAPNPVRPAVRP